MIPESKHNACPDGGACHHTCAEHNCFRVGCCGPLSGVFPGDNWPRDLEFDVQKHIDHLQENAP